jgi:type IV pilus assembly protein PilO
MNLNLDLIKNLPIYQKLLVLGLVIILIVGGFIFLFYNPGHQQIAALQAEISKLSNDINVNQVKVRRLDQLKKENAELELQLKLKQEQLPAETEVESLLKQVYDQALRVGLDFKLWRPGSKKSSPSGLYLELPVDVEVEGGYHTVVSFFDRVSKFPRIVNVSNLKMGSAKMERERVRIQTTFVATAFASAPPGEPAQAAAPKTKPKAQPAKAGAAPGDE